MWNTLLQELGKTEWDLPEPYKRAGSLQDEIQLKTHMNRVMKNGSGNTSCRSD